MFPYKTTRYQNQKAPFLPIEAGLLIYPRTVAIVSPK